MIQLCGLENSIKEAVAGLMRIALSKTRSNHRVITSRKTRTISLEYDEAVHFFQEKVIAIYRLLAKCACVDFRMNL